MWSVLFCLEGALDESCFQNITRQGVTTGAPWKHPAQPCRPEGWLTLLLLGKK